MEELPQSAQHVPRIQPDTVIETPADSSDTLISLPSPAYFAKRDSQTTVELEMGLELPVLGSPRQWLPKDFLQKAIHITWQEALWTKRVILYGGGCGSGAHMRV